VGGDPGAPGTANCAGAPVDFLVIPGILTSYWLVVLKNMSSSVGMMKFQIYGIKLIKHVPNHQPGY
jgi:hypothetical protein